MIRPSLRLDRLEASVASLMASANSADGWDLSRLSDDALRQLRTLRLAQDAGQPLTPANHAALAGLAEKAGTR